MNPEVMRICVMDYLDHIRAIRLDMDTTMERYEEHLASMERLSMTISDMPHDPNLNVDAIPNMVIKMQELLEEVMEAKANYQTQVMRAYEICHVTPEAAMLWAHYVERKTWAHIGDAFGYSMEHALRKSKEGYEPIYTAMPECFKQLEPAL